jgi:hypothetical protein
MSDSVKLTKRCHCGHIADRYRKRTFVNQLGYTVIRAFYRCRNCWSRIHEDFIPELNSAHKINVLELIQLTP